MEYLVLIYAKEADHDNLSQADLGTMYQDYGRCTQSVVGVELVAGRRLEDVATATTVRIRDGKRVVTDGPFAETREQLSGGFYMIQAKDLDEALAALLSASLRRAWDLSK